MDNDVNVNPGRQSHTPTTQFNKVYIAVLF